MVICYLDDVAIETKPCPGSKSPASGMSFRIPRETHGFPYRITVKAVDAIGQTSEDELVIRSQADTAPYVASWLARIFHFCYVIIIMYDTTFNI